MKKSFSILILFFYAITETFPQVVEGTVFDLVTRETICCASIYFNGTSGGTLSDQNGRFRIDVSKFRSMPLIASAIGYYSTTITDFSTGRPLEIFLNQKLFELDEVVVNAKSLARERKVNMSIFRNEFIGTTANAISCRITNEKDIRFKYSEDGDTLKAFALVPIHIINKALGYELTYFLDYFKYNMNSKSLFYKGNILFREDTTITSDDKKLIERRRRFVYLGSRMHYFRSLWVNDLNSTGFSTYNSSKSNSKIEYKDFVYEKDNKTKYLISGNDLGISYYNRQPTSFIQILKELVYFDQTGYFDASAVIWKGEMARQRIADTLPFDYIPDK